MKSLLFLLISLNVLSIICQSKTNSATNQRQIFLGKKLVINQIKQQQIKKTIFIRKGFIKYMCPPCPPGAWCKPCEGDSFVISENDGNWDSNQIAQKVYPTFLKDPTKLIRGKTYAITVKIIERKSAKETLYDAKLLNYKLID